MADRKDSLFWGTIYKKKQNPACCPLIFVEDTDTIDFSGDGTEQNPLSANAILSPNAGNAISSLPNGLFVAPTAGVTANNGLVVTAGVVQFGQVVAGSGGTLIRSTEVPQAGFDIFYSGIGNTIIGRVTSEGSKVQIQGSTGLNQSLLSLKLSATYTNATPIIVTRNSADLVIFEARNPFSGGFTSTFLGKNSGTVCTTNTNVGIGEDCLALVTTGTSNTAIGFRTLATLTTGTSNIAVGHVSQNAMLTGARNITMGRTSLLRATTANSNIVLGDSAMQECLTGNENVAIGYKASGAMQGDNNIAIGGHAMFYQSSTAGLTRPSTLNIAIGYNASFTVQLGTNNVVLGSNANLTGILGDSNILIGAGTDSTASITNTTLIGTSITTALSNIVALGRSDQNILLGNTTPATDNGAKLQVNGDITTSIPLVGSSGKWKLGQFDNNPITATGRIKVNVDGVDYWIAAIAS